MGKKREDNSMRNEMGTRTALWEHKLTVTATKKRNNKSY